MLKFLLALFISIGLAGNARGQELTYTPYEKFDLRSGSYSVIGKIGERIYTYHSNDNEYYLNAYNGNMEKQATVVLDFFPKKIYETRFVAYGDKILVLYQSVQSNKVIQHAAILDHMGMLIRRPITLFTEKAGILGPNRDYFLSAVSENKQHIVLYKVDKKGKQMSVSATWLDSSLAITRSPLRFQADHDIEYGEGMVDNNGNFFISTYTPTGAKNFADQVWLLSADKGEKKFTASELPLNQKYAAGVYMKTDNEKNRIYIGGFYSDKKNGNYEGALYTYYDIATGKYENRRNIALTEEIRKASGERRQKSAFNDYQVRQVVVKSDGGLVMIAEDFYITSRSAYGPGFGYYSMYYPIGGPNVREYHYNDILALSFDPEGHIEWYSYIRKEQYSQEDGGMFSSYALVNTGGMLGFMFNDFNSSQSRIQLATLDNVGQVNMRSLAPGRRDDWIPRSGRQISATEMIVPCVSRKQICFAKVIF